MHEILLCCHLFYCGCYTYWQVKIQGKRVNMMEVERAVLGCPDVVKVVVLHHVISDIASVLVAYYTTIDGRSAEDVDSDVSQRCITSLADFMRPKLVRVDEIPLQSHTGKIDRMALKELYVRDLNKECMENVETLSETKTQVRQVIVWN